MPDKKSFFTRPSVIILSVVLIAQACLLYGFARGEAIRSRVHSTDSPNS